MESYDLFPEIVPPPYAYHIPRQHTILTGTRYERLYTFAREVLGYDRLELKPHAEMCAFLEQCVQPLFYENRPQGQEWSMLATPRYTFKTTLGATALPLWLIVQFPNISILITTHTHKYTKQILSDIKWNIQYNETFKDYFGDLSKDAIKWADDAIIINTRTKSRKEPTIDTAAVDSPKTGGHYDVIIVDDLLTEKTAFTKAGLMKSRRYVNTLRPILDPTGVGIYIFTRWAYNDCYGKLIDEEEKYLREQRKQGIADPKPLYRKLIRGAYLPDGSLYAPAILPESILKEYREQLTDKEFSCWYLNEPIEEGSKVFPRSVLRFYQGTYTFDMQPFIEVME